LIPSNNAALVVAFFFFLIFFAGAVVVVVVVVRFLTLFPTFVFGVVDLPACAAVNKMAY
jgi:hypothetical protein